MRSRPARQIALLRDDLVLYRNIIAPTEERPAYPETGIHPAGRAISYSYKPALIQSMKHESSIRGTAAFQIVGLQDGRDAVVRFGRE